MYLVVRCPGCRTFTYMDKYQKWKLCPVCGATIDMRKVQVYLDVQKAGEAEAVSCQLQKYLEENKKSDLNDDEIKTIREEYAGWVRSNPPA